MARNRTLNRVGAVAGLGLLAAALAQELRKPPEEREWHGALGVVPYDFRPPTVARARASWWSPEDTRIFTPQVFGVGWTLNVGRLARLAKLA